MLEVRTLWRLPILYYPSYFI